MNHTQKTCTSCLKKQDCENFAMTEKGRKRTCSTCQDRIAEEKTTSHQRLLEQKKRYRIRRAAKAGRVLRLMDPASKEARKVEKDAARAAREDAKRKQRESKPPRITARERYAADPEYRAKVLAKWKARYLDHGDKERLRVSIYKHSHPDKAAAQGSRRYERLSTTSDGTLTRNVVKDLFAQSIRCPYCADPYKKSRKSMDHLKPLASGGAHSISNVAICCLKCNTRKNTLSVTEWLMFLKGVK